TTSNSIKVKPVRFFIGLQPSRKPCDCGQVRHFAVESCCGRPSDTAVGKGGCRQATATLLKAKNARAGFSLRTWPRPSGSSKRLVRHRRPPCAGPESR